MYTAIIFILLLILAGVIHIALMCRGYVVNSRGYLANSETILEYAKKYFKYGDNRAADAAESLSEVTRKAASIESTAASVQAAVQKLPEKVAEKIKSGSADGEGPTSYSPNPGNGS